MSLLPEGVQYLVHHGDCIPHMASMPPGEVDFSVFSPPFPALFAYTSSEADIGNSEDVQREAKIHLSFFFRQLVRVMRPGRIICLHCMQIPRLKRSGFAGTFDFRGMLIRLAQRAGLIYHYDWLIGKNPQTEAVRTHSHSLQFASLERDRAKMHGQMGDYLLVFEAPGENAIPIDSPNQVSRNEWIAWAESSWPWRGPDSIRQTDTLNTSEAKGPQDVKHICPLQLGVIDRCIRLYSNPGEIVFSPFAGIGSELYMALKLGRRGYGCELKDEYHRAAIMNCERALASVKADSRTLWSMADANADEAAA